MRTLLAALFGFGFSIFTEGFSRIIISFFHKQSFVFFGIDSLPGISWITIIYFVSTISSWLGAMLAQSIAHKKSKSALYFFILFLFVWILFELIVTYRVVPLWYLISFPITSLFGVFLAHKTYNLNSDAIKNTTS